MIITKIKSQSEAGREYEVTLSENGWHCTCFAYQYSKAVPQSCKHIPEAYRKLEARLNVPVSENTPVDPMKPL